MGMMVLLLEAEAEVASVDAATARRLLDLGVTSVSLLRDAADTALVLDGWAFDPARSGSTAAAIFGAERGMRPVFHTVLTPDPSSEDIPGRKPRESPVVEGAADA